MKAIKKVEVTPIDLNIGKIVNSASTSDDSTKNTYSTTEEQDFNFKLVLMKIS